MGRLNDLTGQRFGHWTVKCRAGKDKNNHALWLCDCDCGNEGVVLGTNLIRGLSTSCGCEKKKKFDDEIQKLIGCKFNKLTVIERAQNYISPKGKPRTMLKCECECGNVIVVEKYHVTSGITQSCGCLQKETASVMGTKHGMHGTHIYSIWDNMIGRCYRKSNPRYHRYGGRGIIVCDEWKQFDKFYEYVSKLPHYNEEGYTLDRIDVNGNYEPNNVRWANDETQANNKSTNHYLSYNGETKTMTQWARDINISPSTLSNRIYSGWSVDQALTTPVKDK